MSRSIPEDSEMLEEESRMDQNNGPGSSSWFSSMSLWSSGTLLGSSTSPTNAESFNSSRREVLLEEEAPRIKPVVVLEASLDMRKGSRGLWKRHYVVVNFGNSTITCHRAPVLKKNPTRVDPVALQIPASADWKCLDVDNTNNMFVIQINTSPGQYLQLDSSLDDTLTLADASLADAGDEASIVSTELLGGFIKDSYEKDFSKAKKSKKPLRYFFRFHHDAKLKKFWLKTMKQNERLSDQSERKRKVLSFVPAPNPHKSRTSSTGSVTSSITSSGIFAPLNARRASTVPLEAHEQAELLAQKRGATASERFLINPAYAYPNTRMDRDELRAEMNKPSAHYHDLRVPSRHGEEIGLLRVEVLQCLGLPKLDAIGETDGYCLLVCGSYAFKTDVIPSVANPMWLSKMRRACIFPLFDAMARLYVGVFDDDGDEERDDFAGRIVLDIARMRPHCTYDVTLPLRLSGHVYMRRPRGAIRLRFHVSWKSERAAMLSYLPRSVPKFEPHESVTVACTDKKSFQNVALAVHGTHMPGRFSMKMVKALVREINFTRIHILRYMRKRELRNLRSWKNPFITGFVFFAWMHSIYHNTVQYVPGHIITFFLLYLWKNYAQYGMDGPLQQGFLPPTWEEMFAALLFGKSSEGRYITPLDSSENGSEQVNPMQAMGLSARTVDESVDMEEIAKQFRRGVQVTKHRYRLKTYNHVFTGTSGVDFLINRGYADSRAEAVQIGLKLQRMKLFEHVAQAHDFKDERLFYYFLVKQSSSVSLSISSYRPWGKPLFRMLGFYNEDENFEDDQLEMPYSEGSQCPRFTVKESLVIRSKESKNLLKRMVSGDDDDDDAAELGVEGPTEKMGDEAKSAINKLDSFLGPSTRSISRYSLEQEEDEQKEGEENVTVKILNKPPNQDIDFRAPQSDRPITDVLAEARHKVHGVLLHAFDDRLYVVDKNCPDGEKPAKKKRSALGKIKHQVGKTISSSSPGRSDRSKIKESTTTSDFALTSTTSSKKENSNDGKKKSKRQKTRIEAELDENDKLLSVGKYSNSNPWVSKIGVIVQPIVEIAYEWLCLFRALFNLFTWRDPILSFWVSVIAPIVALVLHFFPWRIVLGIAGVFLFGPQNWVMRIIRERKGIPEPDMDKIIRKKKKVQEIEAPDEPLFCNATLDNDPLVYDEMDDSHVRRIAVPYSPLMYSHRFYDWPPEPQYARVRADHPGFNEDDILLAESPSRNISRKLPSHKGPLRFRSNRRGPSSRLQQN